jgi:anti-sigma regulatory factor (Ser/Thr protein kinase)
METTVEVREASQVAEVRRAAAERGRAAGLGVAEAGRLALVATEMSTNLVKYAKGGTVTVTGYEEGAESGVQLVAVDAGPGFADFAAALRDGHSSAGSLGLGLGVIKRSASLFDVYSQPRQGTVLLARVAHTAPRQAAAAAARGFRVAARSLPMRGQVECGDAWAARDHGSRQMLCIADGLGHGPLAAMAAARAMSVFAAAGPEDSPADTIGRAHEALKSTRGVVMAVLSIDRKARTAVFSGIGNIAAVVYAGSEPRHLLSIEGTVGYRVRSVRTQTVEWTPNCLAILSTDGLSGRWSPAKYPGLFAHHPAVIASVLFRDQARDADDATILVAQEN